MEPANGGAGVYAAQHFPERFSAVLTILDEETISLREYLERILVEREKAFVQYMENHKEAINHLAGLQASSHQYVIEKLNTIENRLNAAEGAQLGKKDIWGYVLAIVGFGLAAGIAIFNRFGWPHP
jgi:hypothetical protein